MLEFYMIFARKINKNPEFYMMYAQKFNKMPEFYTIFARKYFFPNLFFLGGEEVPPTPFSYAYDARLICPSRSCWRVLTAFFE